MENPVFFYGKDRGITLEESFRNFSERVCEKERNFPTEYGTLKKSFRLPAGEKADGRKEIQQCRKGAKQ